MCYAIEKMKRTYKGKHQASNPKYQINSNDQKINDRNEVLFLFRSFGFQ